MNSVDLGNRAVGSTIHLLFTSDASGVPTTLAGTPVVSVYKGTSTTQTTTGVTLTADFDSVTGLNLVTIDTSQDGTFYAGATDFSIVITTGTISAVSRAGTVVGRFSLTKEVTTLADGVPHGGPLGSSGATLALQAASITNPSGDALDLVSLTNGSALYAAAIEAGYATISVNKNGPNGPAVELLGNGVNSGGLTIVGSGHTALELSVLFDGVNNGDVVTLATPGGNGLSITAAGTGKHGIVSTGGTGGDGFHGLFSSNALDQVLVDGKTLVAALQIIAAVVAGKCSGAGTSTETFKGLDGSTTRAVETVDAAGNRSGASYP